jgi:hypothetical protein
MSEHKKPEKTTGDVVHGLVKAGISQIPIVGAPTAEIFTLIVAPPYERRRDEWVESIGIGLKELAEKVDGLRLEELSQNDIFITTATHATQAAIRNHQKEKLEALRNAVLNAALPNAPEEDLQLMFLYYVDSFTPWHLVILKFFDNPQEWGNKYNIKYPGFMAGSPSTVLELTFNELQGKQETYDLYVKDLFTRGLLNTDSLHTTMTDAGMFASRTTTLGRQFLNFITSPLSDED